MIGQVVYFRIARAAVIRRMGWPDIGPAEAAKVVGLAKENVGGHHRRAEGRQAMSILCSIPFAASLFSACAGPAPLAVGYVEGDYVLLAPIEVAQVNSIAVKRGDRVEAGTPVALMEEADTTIAVAQAEAALAQAKAQLADLEIGKRPEEIAVLEATVRSTNAQGEQAQRTLTRTQDLTRRGIATQAAARRRDDAARGRPGGQSDRPRPIWRSAACRRAPETIKAAENAGQGRRRRSSTRRAGGCRSAPSRRPRPAASPTSSAIPAILPARRRRCSRCCPTAPSS